ATDVLQQALRAGERAGPAGATGQPDPGVGSAAAVPAWAAHAVPADGVAPARQGPPMTATEVAAPVGSPRFAEEAAQKVTWLVRNGIGEAEIRVKPAELGPIAVRIEMHQNEAIISFAVTQPETRAAVENSLHRLTEMLADSGVALGEANVGGQDFTRGSRDGATRSRVTFASEAAPAAAAGAPAAGVAATPAARSLIDIFA
ncbi:MAG: flagellar hook-length control protein FliK, partial [Burkholderiales bacterium]|nr:flagellar hook-length control protein FliK [Burkholderiales bacterium]